MKSESCQKENGASTSNFQHPTPKASSFGHWELGVGRLRSASAIRRVAATAVVVLIGGSSSLFACPVCFGAEETSMIDGTRLGVLVMLAILFAVQGGFVAFFLYLRKRAKRIADLDLDTEWSELQGTPRTS